VSAALSPGDYFLLGIDLQKETAILEAAYNDSQGVTAAFNLNMLHHLNWRFQGDFKPYQFRHVAFYNQGAHQIEIYIESLVAQQIALKALELTTRFEAGERLHSEISRKFDLHEMGNQLGRHDLGVLRAFTDDREWFGLLLCVKQSAG
ncbi:L-histidine N(alpha)-methyltransferase, partial [filamentous cyanobacterium CCP5]